MVNGHLLDTAVTVNGGGNLGGDGTIPATTVQSGGVLSPGDSPGTLTAGSLFAVAGSTFNEELGGTIAGTQYDQTVIPAGGSVALDSPTLNISFLGGFLPTVGQQFAIIKNRSGSSVMGTLVQETITVADAGFANPNVVSNGSFAYDPTGTPWNFTGIAGIEADGSAWGAANAPDGDGRAAFLQGAGGGPLGDISQSLYLAPGTYTVSFEAAQRGGYGLQPIQVSVNGINLGSTITPTSTSWALYTTTNFTIETAGNYTIQFAATNNSGDNDSFIDDVSLANGNTFTFDGYIFGINYAGGTGQDVVLTVLAQNSANQVRVSKSGLVYNRATQLFGGTITITNIGTTNLIGALDFEVTGLPAGVILANASGIAPDGNPYISIYLANGVLAPGQSITFTVLFKNPKRLSFTYGIFAFEENSNS